MCDENSTARAGALRDGEQLVQELPPRDRVEARDGLVEHEEVRLVAERREHGELLPLADGQRGDAPVERHAPLRDQAVDEIAVASRHETRPRSRAAACR